MVNAVSDKERLKDKESPGQGEGKEQGLGIVEGVQSAVEGADTRFEVGAMVNERIAEDKSRKGDGDIRPGGTQKKDEDEIRASLQRPVEELPPKAVTYFLKRAVHKEIATVQKEVHELSKDVLSNAFALSEAVAKLRKLKLIMKNLAHWAVDFLRSVLERFRKGEKLADMPLPQE